MAVMLFLHRLQFFEGLWLLGGDVQVEVGGWFGETFLSGFWREKCLVRERTQLLWVGLADMAQDPPFVVLQPGHETGLYFDAHVIPFLWSRFVSQRLEAMKVLLKNIEESVQRR